MNNNKFSLTEYLKQFSGWITGIVTFLTMLVGFIVLLRDNPQLMTLVILITTSIAGMIACFRIVTEKTPPLIVGGKGLPKYPKLRTLGIAGFVFIPIFNIIFFASMFGNRVVRVALNGTPTLTPTITITAEKPQIKSLIKINSSMGSTCTGWFMIPEDIDLTQDPFNLMEELYVWKDKNRTANIIIEGGYDIYADIVNVGSKDEIVKIDNQVYFVLESYQPLDRLNVAVFGGGGAIPQGGGCGGGMKAVEFHDIPIRNQPNIVSTSKEFDYFTLSQNEIIEFGFSAYCYDPGLYKFHLEMSAAYQGEEEKILVSSLITAYCPYTISKWGFTSIPHGLLSSENRPHTVFYQEYVLDQNFLFSNKDIRDIPYKALSSNANWIKTKPWTPCESAPESYLYSTYNVPPAGYGAIINPSLSKPVDVYSKPNLLSTVVDKLEPGKWIRFADYQCSDGMVWWEVFWDEVDEKGNLVETHEGDYWVSESDGITRFLLSCTDNPACDQ